MNSLPATFRILATTVAILLGWFAVVTIFAETFVPRLPHVSRDLAATDPISVGLLADWAAAMAPMRGDLVADKASTLASRVSSPKEGQPSHDISVLREQAVASARRSLSLAPHQSKVWLLLATLQKNDSAQFRSGADVLKMSYFTSPGDLNLIPTRLAIVAASAAIADGELKDLARGDIRLILTRRPDLKASIVSAYRLGSADGRAYIEDVVRSIDPGFVASLR